MNRISFVRTKYLRAMKNIGTTLLKICFILQGNVVPTRFIILNYGNP